MHRLRATATATAAARARATATARTLATATRRSPAMPPPPPSSFFPRGITAARASVAMPAVRIAGPSSSMMTPSYQHGASFSSSSTTGDGGMGGGGVTPSSFHGVSLPDDDDSIGNDERDGDDERVGSVGYVDVDIDDAGEKRGDDDDDLLEGESVRRPPSEEELAEFERARMDAHRPSPRLRRLKHWRLRRPATPATTTEETMVSEVAEDAGDDDDDDNDVGDGAYGRLSAMLDDAQDRHKRLLASELSDSSLARSHMAMGELFYRLGRLDGAEEHHMSALRILLEGDQDANDGKDNDKQRSEWDAARVLHSLGSIHLRRGGADDAGEARRWYDESLRRKRKILEAVSSADDNKERRGAPYHCELGKGYNGLATLEVLGGGNAHDGGRRALGLYELAERHYVRHGTRERANDDDDFEEADAAAPPDRSELASRLGSARTHELVSIRSNAAHFLRRNGGEDASIDAAAKFRSALVLAEADAALLECERKENDEEATATNEWRPSEETCDEDHFDRDRDDDTSATFAPSDEERRNATVSIRVDLADCLAASDDHEGAAEEYEIALERHSQHCRLAASAATKGPPRGGDGNHDDKEDEYDYDDEEEENSEEAPTILEAAVRSSLANSLARLGRHVPALEHREESLRMRRRIGGSRHPEVGRALTDLGALLGGPMNDKPRALSCFREALHVYKICAEEAREEVAARGEEDGGGGSRASAEADMYDGCVADAIRNVALIEEALSKAGREGNNGGGYGSRRGGR